MPLRIRRATRNDLSAIGELERRAFDLRIYPLTSPRQYRYLLDKGNADILVVESEGTVCGAAVILYRRSAHYGRLYSIAVAPEFQGGTIGKALFEAVEATIRRKGLKGVLLEIRSDNHRHYQRYLSIGYQEIRRLPEYYPDGGDGIKLRKDFG